MTFAEVLHYSSFPPIILKLDLKQEDFGFPFNSKEFTHIAISKKKEINEQFKIVDVLYAFLTKRNLAIDQISCKYMRGKYRLDVQVAQLSKKSCLWGAEVIAGQVKLISPKYIVKKNTTWFIEY